MKENMKDELKEIVELANSVPERFRDKCFEMLLGYVLRSTGHGKKDAAVVDQEGEEGAPSLDDSHIPAKVKVFSRKYGIPVELLGEVVMMEDGELYFVKEPKGVSIAAGQIQWALLLALRSALLGGEFEVDPEDVRSICKAKGFYDRANFATYFKRKKTATLFKGRLEPQGEPQKLSDEGMDDLAVLIKTLAG